MAENLAVLFNYSLFLIPMLNLSQEFIGRGHTVHPKLEGILPPPSFEPPPVLARTIMRAASLPGQPFHGLFLTQQPE